MSVWARWEKKTKVFTSYFLHFCRRVSFKYVKYSHSPRQQNYQKIYSKNFYEPKNACFETDSRRNRSRILYRIREDFNKEYVQNRLFVGIVFLSHRTLLQLFFYSSVSTMHMPLGGTRSMNAPEVSVTL